MVGFIGFLAFMVIIFGALEGRTTGAKVTFSLLGLVLLAGDVALWLVEQGRL